MRLLIDTCVALWAFGESSKLSNDIKTVLQNIDNEVILFQVSLLEIQLKYNLGRLHLQKKPSQVFSEIKSNFGFTFHSLDSDSIFFLEKLPALHNDPFDRLLVSHAILNGLTIITPDSLIHQYPVPVIWN